jgi:hypothetical protein
VNEATLAAKIGAAVFGRTVDLTKPRGIAEIVVMGQ